MSTFKVGQRVRIVSAGSYPELVGREATILALPDSSLFGEHYNIKVDGDPRDDCFARPHCLAPLTDPLAEQFIERIKKLATEPVLA